MNELELAQAIASGEMDSPQPCGNMWLFALRVTGTGLAFRPKHGEYVYRDPDNYLTDDFVGRCAGLPIIWEHPETELLDGEEYAQRVIGAAMFGYINGDDVWCIARIQNEQAAELMQTESLSTSPCLRIDGGESRDKPELDHPLLMEGRPVFLDHLAIVPNGVWDKGEIPNGIILTRSDSMESETPAVPEKPAEAAQPTLGDVLNAIMALTKVMTAHEKTEPAPAVADPVKDPLDAVGKPEADAVVDAPQNVIADAVACEPEKKPEPLTMADAAMARENSELKARLERLEKTIMPAILNDEQRNEIAQIQSRADSVASAFGESVSPPLPGESPIAYRRRLVKPYQRHSKPWAKVDLNSITDATALAIAESQIYADAIASSTSPDTIGHGKLRAVTKMENGSTVTRYYGDSKAFLGGFINRPVQGRFNKEGHS